jgi:hypothetical protein
LLAQTEDADALADLEACAAIERSNARLACYDGVLGRPTSPAEPAATTAVNPPPSPTTAPGGPAPAAVAGGAAAVSAAAGAAPEAAFSAPDGSSAAASAPPPPPAANDAERTIVVTEVRLRTPSSAVFVTDRGQIWEQTGSGRGRYPETPFEATLEKGSLNSTFLVSPAGGPRIRVRLRQ